MNIVRRGPGHLMVQSNDWERTKKVFAESFECIKIIEKSEKFYDQYMHILSISDSDDTMIMIVPEVKMDATISLEEVSAIVLLHEFASDCLVKIVNLKEEMAIGLTRKSIDRIIMRVTGNHEAYIEAVRKDLDGEVLPLEEYFESNYTGTFVTFTERILDNPVDHKALLKQIVKTDLKTYDALEWLENNRLKYVNASIENKDWTELNIKIYDSYEQFKLHYDRLVYIIEALDAGLVLGESWGKDGAVMFLSVGVYTVRLFTYLDPLEIKKILTGLEYNKDGKRIVDYDLFLKRKKYHWNDIRLEGLNREELGIHYRQELIKQLSEEVLTELMLIEEGAKGVE